MSAVHRSLIGVDWGTSNLRAFRYDGDGQVLARLEAPLGIQKIAAGAFESTLRGLAADWLQGAPPAFLLCGMVGSRQGWVEAPYVPCPAALRDVAQAAVSVPSALGSVHIVPGLSAESAGGLIDVMRGEETQILGMAEDAAPELVIAPGTHSKWAQVAEGTIRAFSTFVTGELYAVLRQHSILGRLMQGESEDAAAFGQGVQRALAHPAPLALLFSVRTEGLFGRIAPQALPSYLSGLLIGAEVAAGLQAAGASRPAVSVIASDRLGALYRRALELAGVERVRLQDGEAAAAAGLWRIHQMRSGA
jgi:2-dehydro-3-deoxygalactonokinase